MSKQTLNHVLIIGGGIAGPPMGIALRRARIDAVVIVFSTSLGTLMLSDSSLETHLRCRYWRM